MNKLSLKINIFALTLSEMRQISKKRDKCNKYYVRHNDNNINHIKYSE